MNQSRLALGVALAALSQLVSGCDEEKKKDHFSLKEVIEVQGVCWEDHVGKRDTYGGQIVRWQIVETGKILTYGSLFPPLSDQPARSLDEVTHPTSYHTPFGVSFVGLDVDTDQPICVIHGVSDRGEDSQGYDSTCNLEVVKRGTKLPDLFPDKP
jgi:hypothetical protein